MSEHRASGIGARTRLRAAVILTLALVIGIAAGLLAYAGHHNLAHAILCGGGAMATALVVLNIQIARR
ncbi:hypothetical protein OG417_32885 [Actinoallomurus sp. NBC_01490]|uniref:hypothetical protein n=1 Tax=Actinoallomurus sp. NBC_01490 TaxID=2903557 RepID=UPI002E33AF3C|nr:hypothetical protein [Actinoallomurus sp. NBC_01490]